ncbi:IS200/IS605 family transposase [Saccharicrinis sp. FJH2]|uniref:IS200/IS605 family transposase n=1 Tax=Saccharicrinis sp. FJH65 TaxID=3344659 RepID=UPI0035F2930C
MANTYTQFNIHIVFSVKGRENLITNKFRDRLHQYLSGILKNSGQYPLAVNGDKDHVHLFFELNPKTSISNLISIIKSNSTKWINENRFVLGRFSWQEGYGGFSYSRSQRDAVINYITKQELHHRKRTFREEYLELLEKFSIKFKGEYVFEFYE